ncbi:hypothetical protein [uncultured Mediterranean phage uvDeep-CGR2-KM18-C269]|nr:hypothetical protein [uncultured Mediterranean phage uvDeep-CGR2-KM18-C269]
MKNKPCIQCKQIVKTDYDALQKATKFAISTDDGMVCNGCRHLYFYCVDCSKYKHGDMYAGQTIDADCLCLSCAGSSDWCGCSRCEDYLNYSYDCYFTVASGGTVCEGCIDNYRYCDGCETHYREQCNCNHSELIKDYGYRPTPIFKLHSFTAKNKKSVVMISPDGTTYGQPYSTDKISNGHRGNECFIGIELEVDSDNSDIYFEAEKLMSKVNSDWIYLKEDSSISNGFEVVTHPQTFNVWKQRFEEFAPVLELAKRGFNSHNTKTCGLHLSLSRQAFKQTHLYRFSKFVYFNPLFIAKFSRRRLSLLNSWGSPFAITRGSEINVTDYVDYDEESLFGYNRFFLNCLGHAIYSTKSLVEDHRYGRGTALNLPSQRVEFRAPRGTLKKDTFLANIEFVQSLFEFTNGTNVEGLCPLMFKNFIADNNRFKHLYNWIDENIPSGDMLAHSLMYENNVLNEQEARQGKELSRLGNYSKIVETIGG